MKNLKALQYLGFLGGCYGYIKNCHWSAKNMSEHKLCDELSKLIISTQDEIAELVQGIEGKFSISDVKPKRLTYKSTSDLISILLKATKAFHSTYKSKDYIGVKSALENFMGELDKFQYQLKLCLKEDLIRRIKQEIINESKSAILTESFQSSQLRTFFQKHGGVKKVWEGNGKTLINQDGLSDISDDMIGYSQEFPSKNEALNAMFNLKKPRYRNQRSNEDMQYEFNAYEAKDGTTMLVGTYKSMGSPSQKTKERRDANGWNYKNRDSSYMDDSDTYYYGGGKHSPTNDFGLHTNHDFQGKMKDLKQTRQRYHDIYDQKEGESEYQDYRQRQLKRKKDYLDQHYPNRYK